MMLCLSPTTTCPILWGRAHPLGESPSFGGEPNGIPYRIRTGVVAVRGRCPRPLDEGDARAESGALLPHSFAYCKPAFICVFLLPQGFALTLVHERNFIV